LSRLQLPLARLLGTASLGDWAPLITAWAHSDDGRRVMAAVDARVAAGAAVYPAAVFRAFELTPLARTRVVILGQDPYHGPGQAEGLAFSVPTGQRVPPSLRNIFRELQRDLGLPSPMSGALADWASRGVLLLNTTLTVEDGQPAAHSRLGWQTLTDRVVQALAACPQPKVFMLWGAHAQAKAALIPPDPGRHLLLQCNHPSPLAANRPPVPFTGCGHFGQASRFLEEVDGSGMDWTLA
jgi:uracil-DNA glycosylase